MREHWRGIVPLPLRIGRHRGDAAVARGRHGRCNVATPRRGWVQLRGLGVAAGGTAVIKVGRPLKACCQLLLHFGAVRTQVRYFLHGFADEGEEVVRGIFDGLLHHEIARVMRADVSPVVRGDQLGDKVGLCLRGSAGVFQHRLDHVARVLVQGIVPHVLDQQSRRDVDEARAKVEALGNEVVARGVLNQLHQHHLHLSDHLPEIDPRLRGKLQVPAKLVAFTGSLHCGQQISCCKSQSLLDIVDPHWRGIQAEGHTANRRCRGRVPDPGPWRRGHGRHWRLLLHFSPRPPPQARCLPPP
eukprot:Hpha_TRINITY_DN16488_c1_g6::TRINITY_DN16488_c1_g6_i1::g.163189::m.163189